MNFVLLCLSSLSGLKITLRRHWAIFFSSWALKTLGFVLGARNFSKEQWRGWVCGLYQKCWWFTLKGSGRSVVVILHSLLYFLKWMGRTCQPRLNAKQSSLIFCLMNRRHNEVVVSVLDSGLSHLGSLRSWLCMSHNSRSASPLWPGLFES